MEDVKRFRSSTFSVLLLVLATLLCMLAMRSRSQRGWDGLQLGASEAQIISQLGQPLSRVEMDFGTLLHYPDMTLEVQPTGLYSIQVFGDWNTLHRKAESYFGSPVEEWASNRTDWVTDHVVARLYGDEITISPALEMD